MALSTRAAVGIMERGGRRVVGSERERERGARSSYIRLTHQLEQSKAEERREERSEKRYLYFMSERHLTHIEKRRERRDRSL
jgi:hypothetical protein